MSESGQDLMAMGAPGAEHERLKPFVGRFRATIRLWMGPGDPMVATGTMTNTMDLGGRYLRHDYKGDLSEGPFPEFKGRGFWGYNSVTRQFEGVWVDNASTMMQFETGTVDATGKIWTMTGQMADPRSGAMMSKRSVVTLLDDDRHRMESYFSQGGQEFKSMEIDYRRAG